MGRGSNAREMGGLSVVTTTRYTAPPDTQPIRHAMSGLSVAQAALPRPDWLRPTPVGGPPPARCGVFQKCRWKTPARGEGAAPTGKIPHRINRVSPANTQCTRSPSECTNARRRPTQIPTRSQIRAFARFPTELGVSEWSYPGTGKAHCLSEADIIWSTQTRWIELVDCSDRGTARP